MNPSLQGKYCPPGTKQVVGMIRRGESPDGPLDRSHLEEQLAFDTAFVTLEGVLPPGFSGPVAKSVQDLFRPLQVIADRGPEAGSTSSYGLLLGGTRYAVDSDAERTFAIRETSALTVGGFVAVWLENFSAEPAPFRVRLRGHSGRLYRGGPLRDEDAGCSSVWLGMAAPRESVSTDERGIGWALRQARAGSKICREGWNGTGMYLALQSPDEESDNTRACVWLRTAEWHGVPWGCSQTDLLATDWQIFCSEIEVGVEHTQELEEEFAAARRARKRAAALAQLARRNAAVAVRSSASDAVAASEAVAESEAPKDPP